MAFNDVIPNYALQEILDSIPKQYHLPLECAAVFTIDEKYLTSVNIAYSWVNPEGSTGGIISKSVDHPAFDALRKTLAHRGYIKIPEYPCWNGDIVVKDFVLNNAWFKTGEKFLSGAAIKSQINRKVD